MPPLSDAPEDHGHAPLHGGMIRSTPEHRHLEIYLARDGRIEVYPLDKVVNPMSAKGFSGTIQIEEGGESRSYPLEYRSTDEFDLLAASVAPFPGENVVARVDISREGVFWRARFRYNLKANDEVARHDHSPQYGGQVGMAGEYHLEVLFKRPDEYRVYLTDARRAPLSAKLAKEARLTVEPDVPLPETLSLSPNETEAYLWAKGRARPEATQVPVKVELLFAQKPIEMEFLVGGE